MSKTQTEKELKNLAYNIVFLRKNRGFSKKEMTKILGIGIGTLNKLEKGEVPPRMTVIPIINIWKYFGIHPKEQFEGRLQTKNGKA